MHAVFVPRLLPAQDRPISREALDILVWAQEDQDKKGGRV